MALPLIAREYTVMIDQAVGTRLEGDLLKVQQKKPFHSFYVCGGCEGRQTDWIVRITPEGVKDLGEKSMVPELDAVDELFYRVLHHQPATDLAAPDVIQAVKKIETGMIERWSTKPTSKGKSLCLALDSGSNIFTLETRGGRTFISAVQETDLPCEEKP